MKFEIDNESVAAVFLKKVVENIEEIRNLLGDSDFGEIASAISNIRVVSDGESIILLSNRLLNIGLGSAAEKIFEKLREESEFEAKSDFDSFFDIEMDVGDGEIDSPNADSDPGSRSIPRMTEDIGSGGSGYDFDFNLYRSEQEIEMDEEGLDDSSEFYSRETQPPVVNMNFTSREKPDPDEAESRLKPLIKNQDYLFWLNIGQQKKSSILKTSPAFDIVDQLPPKAIIDVVLFSTVGGIKLYPNADIGKLELLGNGKMAVKKSVFNPTNLPKPEYLKDHLFFPVQMPNKEGEFQIRCNLYFKQVLLQSHLVSVLVVSATDSRLSIDSNITGSIINFEPEYRWQLLDYKISNTLNTEVISEIEPHSLSLLLNDNGNGTHGLRFFGGQEAKWQVTLTESSLQDLIRIAREGLREATWGKTTIWTKGLSYHYQNLKPNQWKKNLIDDLVNLAKRGSDILNVLIDEIDRVDPDMDNGGGFAERKKIKNIFWSANRIHIATKENVNQLFPAAMVYDLPLDTSLRNKNYRLCKEFENALDSKTAIKDTTCFKDRCPSFEDDRVICPSGFWGFRLNIGLPVSIGEKIDEVDMRLRYRGNPVISLMVYKDLLLQEQHINRLRHLKPGLLCNYEYSGAEIKNLLKKSAHIMYFYCHGGVNDWGKPCLVVGLEKDEEGIIDANYFNNKEIEWRGPRPLVFINGCHTSALEPEKALSFIGGLVRNSRALGVIGTEITIFEPLATKFAEECLKYFFDGAEIGEAVRLARLRILQDGNPLGLVYIPFVISSLKLVEEP